MKNVLFLNSSGYENVRLSKIVTILHDKGWHLEFIGWNRENKEFSKNPCYDRVVTLQKGGGEGKKILPLLYIIFLIRLFVKLLFEKQLKKKILYPIGFDVALVAWIVSFIRNSQYVYDIWDEFAISHSFPKWLVVIIRNFDKRIRRSAAFYIHVDESRISDLDNDNYVVIYNSPIDVRDYEKTPKYENTFAITGWLNKTRGLQSLYEFAKDKPDIKFIVAGKFLQKEFERKFLSLPNVEYHSFMPQNQLFEIIKNCRGIFSLYDVSIPINRLAASNKLYDAMMLSIPVVVNKELVAAETVKKYDMGYIVDYEYNDSWSCLIEFDLVTCKRKGENGRKLYVKEYEFKTMIEKKLLPRLEAL